MKQNVIPINGGIRINVDASLKSILYVKKTMLRVLVHVFMKMGNILQVLFIIYICENKNYKKNHKKNIQISLLED